MFNPLKYLVQTSLGPMISESFDWNEAVMENDKMILRGVDLNHKAFRKTRFKFVSGRIEETTVTVSGTFPYSLISTPSLKIKGLNFVIRVCNESSKFGTSHVDDATEDFPDPAQDSPLDGTFDALLSSSFHFAGDFLRNEILEASFTSASLDGGKDLSPADGLRDLADIVENMIGRAFLVAEDLSFTILHDNDSQDAKVNLDHSFDDLLKDTPSPKEALTPAIVSPPSSKLTFHIQNLTLKDHISSASEIPSDLLLNVGVFDGVHKYIQALDITLSTCRPCTAEDIILLKVPITWIRLYFSQRDVTSPVHVPVSSIPGAFVSYVESPKLATKSKMEVRTLSIGSFSIVRLEDLDELQKFFPTNKVSLSSPTTSHAKLPILSEIELTLYILPSSSETKSYDNVATNGLTCEHIKVEVNFKISNQNGDLAINGKCNVSEFNAGEYKPILCLMDSFNLTVRHENIILNLPALVAVLDSWQSWQLYLPQKKSNQSELIRIFKTKVDIVIDSMLLNIRCGQRRLELDLSAVKFSFDEELLLSIQTLTLSLTQKLITINGLHLSSRLGGDAGVNEDFMTNRQLFCREDDDATSTKSWSEVGSERNSETENSGIVKGPLKGPSREEMRNPILFASKYIVDVTLNSIKAELNRSDIDSIQLLLDTLPKSPAGSNQLSLSLFFEINAIQFITEKNKLQLKVLEGVLGLNSIDKNLVLLELFVSEVSVYTPLSNGKIWRLVNRCGAGNDMVHVLFTMSDDFEIDVRQMKCTATFNDILFNVAPFATLLPEWNSKITEGDSMSTFLDLVTVFKKGSVTYEGMLETNIIGDSPTNGFVITVVNGAMRVSVDPLLPSFFQGEIRTDKKSFLAQLNVAYLDVSKVTVRTNQAGVYPSMCIVVEFNQFTIETCRDSRKVLMDCLSLLIPKQPLIESDIPSPYSPDPVGLDTFESVDDRAFQPKLSRPSTETQSEFELEMEDMGEEAEWHLDFEDVHAKEDALIDRVTVFPCAANFRLNPDYLNQLPLLQSSVSHQIPDIQFEINEANISWRLFPGLDFEEFEDGEESREREPFHMELHLLKIRFLFQLFPPSLQISKHISLKIRDLEVFDRVPESKFRKFFCYQMQDSSKPPRETDSDMMDISLDGFRADTEELRLKVVVLPIQLSIDQDLVIFVEQFFKDDLSGDVNPEIRSPIVDNTFFQYCEVAAISIRVDYKPKHIDYSSIKQGELSELINFLHLDGAKLFLNGIKLTGITGWHRLVRRMFAIWLPHVKSTQIPQMASALVGVKTLVNLGSGIADLVLLPIEQYQKDGRIYLGISKGSKSFLKATAKEGVRLGSKLASGAHSLLETADSNRPMDVGNPQAVPVRFLKPLIRLTGRLADALVQISHSIDHGSQSSKFK